MTRCAPPAPVVHARRRHTAEAVELAASPLRVDMAAWRRLSPPRRRLVLELSRRVTPSITGESRVAVCAIDTLAATLASDRSNIFAALRTRALRAAVRTVVVCTDRVDFVLAAGRDDQDAMHACLSRAVEVMHFERGGDPDTD